MAEIWKALRLIVGQALRPSLRVGGVLDVKEVGETVARWASAPSLSGLAAIFQNNIPGVQNLYPWVFPLIMAHVGFTLLLLFVAIKLQLPRGRALGKLVALRERGYGERNQWLGAVLGEQIPQMQEQHRQWHDEVLAELKKVSGIEAGLWNTIGNYEPMYVSGINISPRIGGDQLKCLNEWTEDLSRLSNTINELKR